METGLFFYFSFALVVSLSLDQDKEPSFCTSKMEERAMKYLYAKLVGIN